jgi:hypothetical protein
VHVEPHGPHTCRTAARAAEESLLVGELAIELANGIPDVDQRIGRSRTRVERMLADEREQIDVLAGLVARWQVGTHGVAS